MAERADVHRESDADDLGRVAALVARAGLRLPAAEIAGLVSAYRADRAGFERLRTMLADADETAHTFRPTPARGGTP
jgi:hypothetical protein